MSIYDTGKELAKEFKERREDFFIEVVEIEGEEITVTVKYAPVVKKITGEDVFRILLEKL